MTLNFAPLPDKKALEEQLQSRNEQARTNAESLLERMEKGEEIEVTHTVPLQAVSFGPELLLLGIPGEPVSEYAVNSKMEFSDKAGFVWVAGYTNYHFGYLPTSNIQREGGYETRTWSSPVYQGTFADDVEDIVMNGLRGLVDSFSK